VGTLTATQLLPRPLLPPIWRELGGLARPPLPAPPRGDRGAPVVLVPGLLAGDASLRPARELLAAAGHEPHAAGIRLNVGCSEEAVGRLTAAVEALVERDGRRVALVGHSRGGHFARAVAARRPEVVSHAVSLGADLQAMFHCSAPTLAAVEGARRVLQRTGRARREECLTYRCHCTFTAGFQAPFPVDRVRLTSIYSKGDGVVRWQAQLVPYAACVEVTGSHVGLIFNRKSYRAIAMALAAPELAAPS
jgi:triacylglycerol lipase